MKKLITFFALIFFSCTAFSQVQTTNTRVKITTVNELLALDTNTQLVVLDPANGNELKRITAGDLLALAGPSLTAGNGVNINGTVMELGGTLDKTTFVNSDTQQLRIGAELSDGEGGFFWGRGLEVTSTSTNVQNGNNTGLFLDGSNTRLEYFQRGIEIDLNTIRIDAGITGVGGPRKNYFIADEYRFRHNNGSPEQWAILDFQGSGLLGDVTYQFPNISSRLANISGGNGVIQFNSGTNSINSNPNFMWDNLNERLGVGISNPAHTFHLIGDSRHLEVVTDIVGRPVSSGSLFQVLPGTIPASLVDYHGHDRVMTIQGANTSSTTTSVYTHESTARTIATNDVFRLVSYYGLSENNSDNNVTESVGLQLWNRNNGTGNISRAIGSIIYNPRNNAGGTITNAYGIFINDFTTATNDNYGIYSLANNYFDRIEVNSTNKVDNLNADTVDGVHGDNLVYGANSSGSTLDNNVDDYNRSGFYTANPSSTQTPFSGWFNIYHSKIGNNIDYAAQIAIGIENPDAFYFRRKNNGTWNSWRELSYDLQKDLNLNSNDINNIGTLNSSNLVVTNSIITPTFVFANLPTGVVGMTATITDAASISYRGVASGGGSDTALVFFDGTNWIYH